jgi:hypothetical protein
MEKLKHDKHVESIYKKIQITKAQTSEKTKQHKEELLSSQLERVYSKYMQLLQSPNISQKDVMDATRDINNTLDLCLMHSDDDVIKALTNEAITKQYKEKVMNE